MVKINLFDKAKSVAEVKKTEKHTVVNLKPEFEESLIRMAKINTELADLETEKAVLDTEVREAAKLEMINLYDQKKIFPRTLKVVAGTMGFQFITSDKYITIDQERCEELRKTYGNGITNEETTYYFNTEILMKYQEVISDLLMLTKKISDNDKENLLLSNTTFSIKKGTINNLTKIASDKKLKSVGQIMEDIRPIFSIKSIQAI